MPQERSPTNSGQHRDVRQEYALMASGYDTGSRDSGWNAPWFVARRLADMDLISPNARILDFAAGTGALSGALRKYSKENDINFHITATDLSPEMIEQGRGKGHADVFAVQDITKPWRAVVGAESISVAASTGVGEYLTAEALDTTIGHASHVLEAGGAFAFTFLPEDEKARHPEIHMQQAHSIDGVRDTFCRHGIELHTAESFDAYRLPNASIVRHVLAVGIRQP